MGRAWVWQSSSSPEARLGLLCLLKAFPVLGEFTAPSYVPALIVAHIAERAELKGLTLAAYPKRTRARQRIEIRRYLGIQAWRSVAQGLATQTMERIVVPLEGVPARRSGHPERSRRPPGS